MNKIDDWAYEHMPTFLYRLPSNIKDIFYNIQYLLQLIFRKNHVPDRQVWNAGYYIVEYAYPRVKAFIESERMGFPAEFSNYSEDEGWESKEQYDKAIKDGKITGGGQEAWKKILNEILFACEYTIHNDGKEIKNFWEKWDLEDPHEKKESNKTESFINGKPFYYNVKLDMTYQQRAQKGLELLGKYILNLWD